MTALFKGREIMKTRIISAAVATVLAIIVLALHKTFLFPIAVGIIAAVGVFELLRAANCRQFPAPTAISVGYAFLYFFCDFAKDPAMMHYALKGIFALAIAICFFMAHEKMNFYHVAFMTASCMLVPAALGSLVRINDMKYGIFLVVLTLACAWFADSGAYFAGSFLGQHKLCPSISPKKTVEGVVGGAAANAVIALIFCLVYDKLMKDGAVGFNYIMIFLAGVVTSLVGLAGDLTASLIKRQCGIKDYGNLMPGHGGVMDRFDSVLFVAPFMYFLIRTGWLF